MKEVNYHFTDANNVHDLLKKANQCYQKGYIDLSIMYFNEVLEKDPESYVAQYFIKLKKQQIISNPNQKRIDTVNLSSLLLDKQYSQALDVVTSKLVDTQENPQLNELRQLISQKICNDMLHKLGNVGLFYTCGTVNDIDLDDEEKHVLQLFKHGSTIESILDITPINELLLLKILYKFIRYQYIVVFNKKSKSSIRINSVKDLKNNVVQLKIHSEKKQKVNNSNDILIDNKPNSLHNFDELFKSATASYVRRNYKEALELFDQCYAINSIDTRVLHNINKLKERLNIT